MTKKKSKRVSDPLKPLENALIEQINKFFSGDKLEPKLLLKKYSKYNDILSVDSNNADVDSRKNKFDTTEKLLEALEILSSDQKKYEVDNRVDLTFKKLKIQLESPMPDFKKTLCAAYLLAIETEINDYYRQNTDDRTLINVAFRAKMYNKVIEDFNKAVPDDINAFLATMSYESKLKKDQLEPVSSTAVQSTASIVKPEIPNDRRPNELESGDKIDNVLPKTNQPSVAGENFNALFDQLMGTETIFGQSNKKRLPSNVSEALNNGMSLDLRMNDIKHIDKGMFRKLFSPVQFNEMDEERQVTPMDLLMNSSKRVKESILDALKVIRPEVYTSPALQSVLSHYEHAASKPEDSRRHAFTVNFENVEENTIGFNEFKGKYKELSGDILKTSILNDFRESIKDVNSSDELETKISEFKSKPEYKILQIGQGLTTRTLNLFGNIKETSSVKAFKEICAEAQKELPQANTTSSLAK